MSKPIIEVEHLSKCYRIGAMREPYLSLRDELARKTRRISSAFSRIVSKSQNQPSTSETDFWALNDVSFSVEEGDAVGIIGRNGAGKSTLLKILSQITPPTEGQITMRGRVASLLEVGTGFHPELTGRENIFLNGAVLGMTRVEIRRKFDEIVAFAEVDKFLDTPVKRYSSGMYVRLAFAVAAHLEPEILIVDEVLAVGDAQFQKKCLGKMGEVSKGGRTVLFVSHNMAAIQSLCRKCITLDAGNIVANSDVVSAIRIYMNRYKDMAKINNAIKGTSRINKLVIANCNNEYVESIQSGSASVFNIICYLSDLNSKYSVAIDVYNNSGNRVFYCNSEIVTGSAFTVSTNNIVFKCDIARLPLMSGIYYAHVSLTQDNERVDFIENAIMFEVVEGDFWGSGRFVSGDNPPIILVDHHWSVINQ